MIRETVSRAGVRLKSDHQQSPDRLPSPMVRLHIRLIPENDALGLHTGDPLADGAARQPDLASKVLRGSRAFC